MANINLPFTYAPRTLWTANAINANLSEIATKFNTTSVQTDVAATVTVSHTFTQKQNFTGGITSLVSNTASGTTASLANGAGSTILSPSVSGSYFLVSKAAGTHSYHATAVCTYDTTTNLVTVTVLASNGITLAASSGVVTLTNATGSTNTFSYAYLRLL